MAIVNDQADQDFEDKLKLESLLRKEITTLNSDIVKKFRRDMLNGQVTRADDFQPELEAILANHYELVADKFEGRITSQIPEDVGFSKEEELLFASALVLFIKSKSFVQSEHIIRTTKSNMRLATRLAAAQTPDQIERAVVSSSLLSRKLGSRVTGIVSFETQVMAESVKRAEIQVLAGVNPFSPEAPSNLAGIPIQQWDTRGDGLVRPAHVTADSQERALDEPFDVGGERLRFPGDTSLGASKANTRNCRCTVIYNTEAIAVNRASDG